MIGGMDYILPLLLNNQWYVGYLFLIMVASAFVQKNGLIYTVLETIFKYIPMNVVSPVIGGLSPNSRYIKSLTKIIDGNLFAPK